MPLPPPGPIEGATARILAERKTRISPWVQVVEQDVLFPGRERSDLWHIVAEADGVVTLPVLPDGRFAMIGQFRPALRAYSWEFPAGMVDAGETPEQAAIRECREETGLTVRRLIRFGAFAPAPARLAARVTAFAAETEIPAEPFQPEEGVKLALVTREDIHAGFVSGQIQALAHIGLLYMWDLYRAGQWPGVRHVETPADAFDICP